MWKCKMLQEIQQAQQERTRTVKVQYSMQTEEGLNLISSCQLALHSFNQIADGKRIRCAWKTAFEIQARLLEQL